MANGDTNAFTPAVTRVLLDLVRSVAYPRHLSRKLLTNLAFIDQLKRHMRSTHKTEIQIPTPLLGSPTDDQLAFPIQSQVPFGMA